MKKLKTSCCLLFIFSLILFSCNKNEKTKPPRGNNRNKLPKEKKYKRSMQILSEDNKEYSYFTNDSICIKIPVPNKDFKIYGIYNISKKYNRIFVHISDLENTYICGETDLNFILEDIISISDIEEVKNSKPFIIEEIENIQVIVFNDKVSNFTSERDSILYKAMKADFIPTNCEIQAKFLDEKQPKEAGGGVIIRPGGLLKE